MKSRNITKIAISVSIAGLCLGFLLYFWFKAQREQSNRDFDLFSLVPQSAVAVVETERMDKLVRDMDDLSQSNVLVKLHRIRERLKKQLQDEEQ